MRRRSQADLRLESRALRRWSRWSKARPEARHSSEVIQAPLGAGGGKVRMTRASSWSWWRMVRWRDWTTEGSRLQTWSLARVANAAERWAMRWAMPGRVIQAVSFSRVVW